MELRFHMARSTVDIDLTVQNVPDSKLGDANETVRDMLQRVAGINLGDWFEFMIGPPLMDLTAAPYGGARSVSGRSADGPKDLRAIPPGRRHWGRGHGAA